MATKRKRKLDPLREQLAILTDEANARVSQLMEKGYESRALQEAIRTLRPSMRASAEETGRLFESDLPRTRDIMRELSRVQNFLGDFTSLSEGAEAYTSTMKKAHLFGGDYRDEYGVSYDASQVTQDDAERTFGIYNRLLEQIGGWDRMMMMFRANLGMMTYGSENLINAIYDMVDNGMTDENIMTRAMILVNTGIERYEEVSELQRSNKDYGLIIEDGDVEARREFYKWQKLRRELKKNGK